MTGSQVPSQDQLLALKGRTVSLPDLLRLFGARVRNYQTVPAITAALKDAGLTTVPSFTTCGNKAEVLVLAGEAVPDTGDGDPDEQESGEMAPGTLPQHSFRIGDIASARGGLESFTSDEPLTTATHRMIVKNFSQVAVVDGTSDLRGVVTWRSVARLYEEGATPTLVNAMLKDSLPVAEVHQELFMHLPVVIEHGYVLVRENSGRFTGIVTAADITTRFQATALPFFLVGDIEFRLRKCLGAKLSPDAIRAVQPNKPEKQTGNIADLMFGDYVKLLKGDQQSSALCAEADANWQTLDWKGVHRTQFVHDLDRVRWIRNKIAHFDADPLTPQLITELREFVGLLKELT